MKVLVTGGTGFVGREILRELCEAGHHIRLLVRDAHSPAAVQFASEYRAELRQGNILNAASLPKAVHGTDAVIHLVGIISETGEQTFQNVHVRGTENVVLAAITAGVRRMIHMSALGTRAKAASRYHQSKWVAEEIVSKSLLDWTIFRPSLIYGPEDKFVNLFADIAERSPVLPMLASKQAVFQPVGVENVARCFVRALAEPQSIRQIFDICGPDRLTLEEMIRTILAVTNRKRRLVHVPLEYSKPLTGLTEFFHSRVLKKAPPLNRDQLLMLQESNVGDAEWTNALFKLEHAHFEEGIARYLKPAMSEQPQEENHVPTGE